ncbi:glycoside hydrolase family 5 protein [Agathobaculum hominis]
MNYRKKLVKILACGMIAGFMLMTGCTDRTAKDGAAAHGQLAVMDGTLIDAEGNPFQLRGMSTHGIAWYPKFINSEAFSSIKSAGGNVVRVAMYTDTENGYLADPEKNFELITSAVSIAEELDMYVIIDWHILSDGDPNANLDAAVSFFEQVAALYPDDPSVIYEICNEPNGVDWSDIKSYADCVIPEIRKYSENALIIVGTPNYSANLSGALLDPLPYDNLMYAYHFYAGLHNNFEALKYAVSQKFPVFVSEWGIDEDETGSPALSAGQEFVDYLNDEKLSWCGWSLCNKDEVFSALKPEAAPDGNWEKSDFTEVGQILFAALQGSSE